MLDIAFAAEAQGSSFERVTLPFIQGLGPRLVMWIDHHDHALHVKYRHDPRFVLSTKAEHGACPEMVTPELVERAGPVDTICCHVDFDGLCSAAKWMRSGIEPYPGADDDARCIDTRMGTPSERAEIMDRALRARPRDEALRGIIVQFLVGGGTDAGLYDRIKKAAEELRRVEEETRRLALGYEMRSDVAVVNASEHKSPYDKTLLLLIGQERAPVSVVYDRTTVTVAARFDSGLNLLALFGLSGGMPTRVSLGLDRLDEVLARLVTRDRSAETK